MNTELIAAMGAAAMPAAAQAGPAPVAPPFTLDPLPASPSTDLPLPAAPVAAKAAPDADADPAAALLELLNTLVGTAPPAASAASAAAAAAETSTPSLPPEQADLPPAEAGGVMADPALLVSQPMPAPPPPQALAPLPAEALASAPRHAPGAAIEALTLNAEAALPTAAGAGSVEAAPAAAPQQLAEPPGAPRFELLSAANGAPPRTVSEAAAPLPTPQPAASLEEFSEQVVWQVQRGLQEARIQLRPDSLGAVDVQLQLHEDQASLVFTAEQPQARAALQAALPQLTQMLAGQGVMLADAQVQSQNRGHAPAPPPRRGPRDEGPAEPAAAAAAPRRRLGLIDHYA